MKLVVPSHIFVATEYRHMFLTPPVFKSRTQEEHQWRSLNESISLSEWLCNLTMAFIACFFAASVCDIPVTLALTSY